MACLVMYNQNSDNKDLCAPTMSPRISFSNDFVESNHSLSHHQQLIKHGRPSGDAPVCSDFEFSVTNYSMMSADELFFKGRLLPFKQSCTQKTTLRDELLVEDEYDDELSMRPPKGSNRWKELLGLKKTHIGSKKSAKLDGLVERRPSFALEETHAKLTQQEVFNDGESSCRDVDFGV